MTAEPNTKRPQTSRSIPVTDSFTRGTIEWCSRANTDCSDLGTYTFLWKPVAIDGFIEICGVSSSSTDNIERQSKASMKQAHVEYMGGTILTDMSYFNEVEASSGFDGATATCRTTSLVEPAGEWRVRLFVPTRKDQF